MDDLLTLASELVANDSYKTEGYSTESKPDGDYTVVIDNIKLKTSEKGTEWFAFTLNVLDGEYANEKFYVNLFLTEKTVKGTLSKIMNLINSLGYTVQLDMFADKDSILNILKETVGETTILTKKTSNNGFINYSFKGGE